MNQNNASNNILIFDGNLQLVGMFSSPYTASKATGVSHQMIRRACSGEVVAAGSLYWREANNKEFIFDCDDLGKLSLLEFDSTIGENRKIYRTRSMKKNDIILESEYANNNSNS